MSKLKLQKATLFYGVAEYPVEAHEGFPFPQEFDLDGDVRLQAMKILAMMSHASGGHTLNNCKLSVSRECGRVTIMANGVMVTYRNDVMPEKLTLEQVQAWVASTKKHDLGSVVTDQYGDGWKRATWKA